MSTFETVYHFVKLPWVALKTKFRTGKWPDEHWFIIGATIASGVAQFVLTLLIGSILMAMLG